MSNELFGTKITDPVIQEMFKKDIRQMQRLCLVGTKIGGKYYRAPARKIGNKWYVIIDELKEYFKNPTSKINKGVEK